MKTEVEDRHGEAGRELRKRGGRRMGDENGENERRREHVHVT